MNERIDRNRNRNRTRRACSSTLGAFLLVFAARAAHGETTPPAASTAPDDTPSIKLGTVIYADYTYQSEPEGTNAAGSFHPTAFNVTRAYLNVTGNLNHWLSFRVTPDITRETLTVTGLPPGTVVTLGTSGSYELRLKYAFAQLNLDDHLVKGSWARLGLQQTPYIDQMEAIYRYRFQGQIFVEREGYLISSDAGLSARFTFPGNYGDAHVGYYNGDGFNRAEANNQKSLQVRASLRPVPGGDVLKGLKLALFYDQDAPMSGGTRDRKIANVTFEHPWVNAGFEYLRANDRASSAVAEVEGEGWSVFATPKLGRRFEALVRYDELQADRSLDAKKKRGIVGVSYWFPADKGITSALMLDYDRAKYEDFLTPPPDEERWALHLLVNY